MLSPVREFLRRIGGFDADASVLPTLLNPGNCLFLNNSREHEISAKLNSKRNTFSRLPVVECPLQDIAETPP